MDKNLKMRRFRTYYTGKKPTVSRVLVEKERLSGPMTTCEGRHEGAEPSESGYARIEMKKKIGFDV